MTPNDLRERLSSLYLTDMSDGTVIEPDGQQFRPHTIQANPGDPSGEVATDVRDIVTHLVETGETGTYVLMQWLDVSDAAAFAGLSDSDDHYGFVNNICLVDDEPTDAEDFFETEFQINGFFRRVTPAMRDELNDCSQFQLMLIPKKD